MHRLIAALILLALISPFADAKQVILADKGAAQLPIIIAPDATDSLRKDAEELARLLEEISGAPFQINEMEAQTSGIFLGTAAQFPTLAGEGTFAPNDPLRREEYLIRTQSGALHLIGATETGASHAMWDLLHRLGYRHYFPPAEWEIIPRRERLTIEVNSLEKPDYVVRRIWFGFGVWPENREPNTQWQKKNRLSHGEAFYLSTGHTYDVIIRSIQDRLENEPSLVSQIDGKRTNKLNAGNPETLKATIDAKISEVERAKKERVDSVSMDPSDGGGWGESPEELAIGTPSDRVVYLANEVIKALREKFGYDIYAGTYAYHMHYPPPTRQKVDPRVIVSFATAFTTGNLTLDQTMEGWRNAGMKLAGIREYFSVHAWDFDQPASGRAADLSYVNETIPAFYEKGARFYSSESGDNWGPHGLGYYLAAHLLWDTTATIPPETLIDEFVANCFPQAQEPMRRFYHEAIHPAPNRRRPLNPDLIGRMYRALNEAMTLTSDPLARERLTQLMLYTRHLENLRAYQLAPKDEKEERLGDLLRHSWRMRKNTMTHSYAQWRSHTDRYRRAQEGDPVRERYWQVPTEQNPWKSDEPFTESEVQGFVEQGIASNQLIEFEPVSFSRNLVPATLIPSLQGIDTPIPVKRNWRGNTPIHTMIEDATKPLEFQTASGFIYQMFGDARFELFEVGDLPMQGEADEASPQNVLLFSEPVDKMQIPPDKQEHTIRLQPRKTGLHIVRMNDRANGTLIDWPETHHFTLESSTQYVNSRMHRFRFWFYVPKGTKVIGAFASGNGNVWAPDKTKRLALPGGNQYVSIPVEEGEDGQCWQFEGANGTLALMTVPPYMAPTVSQLLLPREVVEADSGTADP